MIKLVKKISQSGYCSRREAQRLILAGKVFVNGQVIKESAHLVDEQNDHVKVGQGKIQKQAPELWMLHKPIGYLTSHNDPHHKKTVFDFRIISSA